MRKTLAVILSTAVALIWLSYRDLSIRAQTGNGEPLATENGDVNGDGKRDIADAVGLLTWIFEGGPEPVAFACEGECDDPGRRLAGTYLVNGVLPAGEDVKIPFKMLATYTADGAYVYESTFDFGKDVPDAFKGAVRGAWRQTGPREFAGTSLHFAFDADGANFGILKFSETLQFDEDFQSYSLAVTFEVFAPDQDPLGPDGMPFTAGAFSGEGRRILAE